MMDSIFKPHHFRKVPVLVLCFMAMSFSSKMGENAQTATPGFENDLEVVSVRGTGRTTGHIATLTVKNQGNEPVTTSSQTVFIPSSGRYQSYVGRIPGGITIPPGATMDIPVGGYCTDIHRPPVPSWNDMPPVETWILVVPSKGITPPVGDETVTIIPGITVPAFTPENIPGITQTPGYTPGIEREGTPVSITYPGTEIPVGGTIDPDENPSAFAPMVVRVVEEVENAVTVIQENPVLKTPHSGDPETERESTIQQAVWIYMGTVTGDPYEKDDFADNVYEQFEENTGVAVSGLREEQKEQIDEGIDDFWSVFVATGVEAKVFRNDSTAQAQIFPHLDKDELKKKLEKQDGQAEGDSTGENPEQVPGAESGESESEEEEEPDDCECDSLTFNVATDFGGLPANSSREKIEKFTASKASPHKVVIEIDEDQFKQMVTVNVTGITVFCSACDETPCEYYSGNIRKPEPDRIRSVEISGVTVNGADVAEDGETVSVNGISVEATPKKKTANFFITFKVSATCMADECERDVCIRYISIEVKVKKN
jgi:hypothetical protein